MLALPQIAGHFENFIKAMLCMQHAGTVSRAQGLGLATTGIGRESLSKLSNWWLHILILYSYIHIHISHNMPEHQKKEYFESLGLDWSNINKYYYTVNNLNTIYNTNSQKYYLYKNVKLFKNVYNNYFNLYNNYFKTTIVMMHMILLWMVYIKTYLLTHLNRI